MSETLLQSIVEKLDSFEIALLKKSSDTDPALQNLLQEIKLFQLKIAKLASPLEENSEKMNELSRGIRQLNFNLSRPINEQIKHHHHLHKGIWISIGLFIISILISYGWMNCYNAKKSFEANDMKYRYLKVDGNVSLLKILYQTDSLYDLNNELFEKKVLENERDFSQRTKALKLSALKKKDSEGARK